jgi:hypothetical protein
MIAFLFTGQARTSPFAHNPTNKSDEIMNSYKNYIFTDDFKNKYKYKIYISTDDVHLSNTINYFDVNNIGNIHLLNTGYYMNPIENKLKPVDFFIDQYNKMMFFKNHSVNILKRKNLNGIQKKIKFIKSNQQYQKFEGSIYQHYKLLDAYNLLSNDNDVLQQCTLICRLRLDIVINVNILELIDKFINPNCEIVCHWDIFAIGRKEIMECYLNVLIKNGSYTNEMKMPQNLIIPDYETSSCDKNCWSYAPEIQLFKMLCDFCITHNLNIMDAMKLAVDNNVVNNECVYSKEIKILRF